MSGLLKLAPDTPVEIALSSVEGINVVSPLGTPAVRYTLADGRTFFATQYVHAKFKKLKIEPLERITLCMRHIDGKHITTVERVPPDSKTEPQPESPPCNATANDPFPPPELLNDSVANANGNHPSSVSPEQPESTPPTDTTPGSETEKTRSELMNELGSVIANGEQTSRPISQLERALRTAILAAHSAEQYGKEIGYPIRFDQESVKSMAVTVLIGMQGGRY